MKKLMITVAAVAAFTTAAHASDEAAAAAINFGRLRAFNNICHMDVVKGYRELLIETAKADQPPFFVEAESYNAELRLLGKVGAKSYCIDAMGGFLKNDLQVFDLKAKQ